MDDAVDVPNTQNAEAFFHAGIAHAKQQAWTEAISSLEKAFALCADNAWTTLALAQAYDQIDQHACALKYYERTLKLAPGWIEAHYQLGMSFLKRESFEYAHRQFSNVLALMPTHLKALFHLGICAFQLNDHNAAERAFEQIIQQNPSDVEAWVNLGAIALKKQESQLAISRFTQALSLDESHIEARANLAATFMHYARHENALTHYLILLERFPEHTDYLYQTAIAEMTLGQLSQAKIRLLSLSRTQPERFEVLYHLGIVTWRLQERQEAQYFLQAALRLQPEDCRCQHLLAALTGDTVSEAASAGYANHLFEQYAHYYDKHMMTTLTYQLPVVIEVMLLQVRDHWTDVLDLGCGTGLCGERLRPHCDQLVGVDISPNMLARAEEKRCYDLCIAKEAVAFLSETSLRFEAIVAVDVLPYLGDLSALFQGIARVLRVGGVFFCSIEQNQQADWTLQETARYAHHSQYIHRLCQQYQLVIFEETEKQARSQAGEAVSVRVFGLRAITPVISSDTSQPVDDLSNADEPLVCLADHQ